MAGLVLVWACWLVWSYHGSELYLRLAIDLSGSALISMMAGVLSLFVLCLGGQFLRLFRLGRQRVEEEIPFAGAIGLAILAILVMGMGATRQLTFGASVFLLLVFGLICSPYLFHLWPRVVKSCSGIRPFSFLEVLLLGLLFLHMALYLMVCLAPTLAGDAVKYHMTVPKLWAVNGSFSLEPFAKDLSYVNLPILLKTFAFLLKGGILAQLLNGPVVSLIALISLYVFVRRLLPRVYTLLVLNIFLDNPELLFANYKAGYHPSWYLFEILTLGCFALGLWASAPEKDRWVYFKWSAVFGGIGFWSYYCMGFTLLMLTISFPPILLFYFGKTYQDTAKMWLIWMGIGLTAAVPLFVGNVLVSGNPLFPYFNVFWGLNQKAIGIGSSMHHGLLDALRILWDMIMKTMPNSGIKHPSPVLILLLPFLFLYKGWTRPVGVSLLFFLASFSLWFVFVPTSRHFIPTSLVLSCILCYLFWTVSHEKSLLRTTVMTFAVVLFAMNLVDQSAYYLQNGHRWRYVLGQETRDDYLKWGLKSAGAFPTWGVTNFINNRTEDDARVFAVHFPGRFFLERPYLSVYQKLGQDLLAIKDFHILLKKMKELGITHLLINQRVVGRLVFGSKPYSEKVKFLVKSSPLSTPEFQDRYLRLVRKDGDDYLYQLRYPCKNILPRPSQE